MHEDDLGYCYSQQFLNNICSGEQKKDCTWLIFQKRLYLNVWQKSTMITTYIFEGGRLSLVQIFPKNTNFRASFRIDLACSLCFRNLACRVARFKARSSL